MDKENRNPNIPKTTTDTATDIYRQKKTAQKKFEELTEKEKNKAAQKHALGGPSVARGRSKARKSRKSRKTRKSRKSRKTKRRQRR